MIILNDNNSNDNNIQYPKHHNKSNLFAIVCCDDLPGVDPAGSAGAATAAFDGAAGRCGLALEAGLWGFHSAAGLKPINL